jgi:hypothetical protein
MNILGDVVSRSLLLFLWGGSLLAIVVGFGLLLIPLKLEQMNRKLTYWFDTSKMASELDRPRWLERYIYRHHRFFGGALFAGSIFIIYAFLLHPITRKVSALASNDVLGLLDAGVALLVIFGVLGLVIGLVLMTKPSLLRDLEAASNRWISTAEMVKSLDKMHSGFEKRVFVARMISAAYLIFGGAYVAFRLGVVLFVHRWGL